jgi:hypothetical protein
MSDLERAPTRADVNRLQKEMVKFPQIQLETRHYFADGMYCRELFRPAGTAIVGKVHKREHFYIVCSGEVTIVGDGYRQTVKGPRILVSEPGTKRAVYAHTDTTCITMHRTDLKDLAEIERELIETDETALFDARNELKFNPEKFRELTAKVIANEKSGFWEDWSKGEQELYKAGDWRAFSVSRGYTEEQIAEYQEWLDMVRIALNSGINPHSFTIDLTTQAALANIARAGGSVEILKSSHAPFESRETP